MARIKKRRRRARKPSERTAPTKYEGYRRVIKWVETPRYIVADLKNPPKRLVRGYRTIRVDGHLVRVAILNRQGKRGGHTVATSIWHPKSEFKRLGKNKWLKRDIKRVIYTKPSS